VNSGYGGLLVFKGWYISAERAKASTVSTRSEIVGSNSTRVLEICVPLFAVCFLLCVVGGLASGWSLV
jgi:hypothetical protein